MAVTDIKDYAYPNARIRGMKSRLLERKDFERACGLDSLSSFLGFLEDYGYGKPSDVKELNHEVIEQVLLKHLMDCSSMIHKLSSRRASVFMYERFMRYEYTAVKGIVNSRPRERMPFKSSLSPELRSRFNQLNEAQDLERLIDAFSGTKYEKIIRGALEDCEKTKLTFPINLAIDKYHYSKLFEGMKSLSGLDGKSAYEILGVEADTINIMTVLRTTGMEGSYKYIIPHFFRVGRGVLKDCVESRNAGDVVEKLSGTVYHELLSRSLDEYGKTNSLFVFEKSLKEHLLLFNRILLVKNIFNISTLLSYMTLKENEIENLRKIAVGLGNNLPEDEIREVLVY